MTEHDPKDKKPTELTEEVLEHVSGGVRADKDHGVVQPKRPEDKDLADLEVER